MYVAWHTAANDVYSQQQRGWYLLSTQHHTGHAKQLLPLCGSQGERAEARKQLRQFSVGMTWLTLSSIKPHNHPCIFESGCQRKERHPTAPGISRIKKKLNKATWDFLSFCRETATHKGLNYEYSLQLRKRVRRVTAAGIYIKTWTSISLWVEVCQTLTCGLQAQAGSAGALEKLQLQSDRNLMLKQRQMQSPVVGMEKSISTGWGANSCWAVMQNPNRFGVGRNQPPHVV